MSAQECNVDKIIRVLSNLETELKKIPLSNKGSFNKYEQPGDIQSEEKRSSSWSLVRATFNIFGKVKNKVSNHASDSGGSQGGGQNIDEDQEDADLEIQKLQSDIRQMKTAINNLNQFQINMIKSLEHELPSIRLTANLKKTVSIRSRRSDNLKDIRKNIFNLKCEIPSLLYKQSSKDVNNTASQTAGENAEINETGSDIFLPGLHVSKAFRDSSACKEVVEKFEDLGFTQKLCLLSFAVFPENREVTRTMLMYWWIGEGFISCDDSKNLETEGILELENSVTRILDEFLTKGLLEPVEDERRVKPNSYKMEPHVHSAVIYLAKYMELFQLYNKTGEPTMDKSSKAKVCLVRGSSLSLLAKATKMQPEKLQTVFNSSERYPDFTFKWFRTMNLLKVLYLGRWERTAKRHIEVESTEFLMNMKFLKNLRLASFQGISRIEKLENTMCEIPELVILDLKACYNLEELPEDIGLLKKLIYLDVSECYMLDRMPKGIADLTKLQVLKGFVISESDDESKCAVKHLVNLRKLSITVNKYNFTVESLMKSLTSLKQLESLKIAWGFRRDNQKGGKSPETHGAEKGQSSEEKKGDVKETGKRQDGLNSKKEDGSYEIANLEAGKKHGEVNTESLKSDKVVKEEKKTSPPQEVTETIQKKPDNDLKGKNKMKEEGDGGNNKADLEEGKERNEITAESSNSEKKASPSGEATETIQNKPGDQKGTSNVEGNGDKKKADLEEGKKQDQVHGEESKQDKDVEGEKKVNPPQESSSDMIQKKPDDRSKVEKEGDGDKGKADQDEGKKRDEVEEAKKGIPQESKDTIQSKVDDVTKVEKEGGGNKGKANPEDGKKKDEVEAENLKSENGDEGLKKASPSQESKDAIQKKPDDHEGGEKQRDGEKEKVNLEEGKKKNEEVKADSSKSDKVIKGDEKKNPPQESKETIQSKLDDHREISKVQEIGDKGKNGDDLKKLDGGEAKTEKSKKTTKLGKKVIVSENYETPSPSRPHKDSKSSKAKWFLAMGNQTKSWWQENPAVDTSKLPSSLKKLELECFPEQEPPTWLNPKDLNNLEKLSIKGGKLSEFSTSENKWDVQILRLKYLHEFKVEWRDLQEMFPKMTLLEKYQCPKIAFCPTDGNGVWRKP